MDLIRLFCRVQAFAYLLWRSFCFSSMAVYAKQTSLDRCLRRASTELLEEKLRFAKNILMLAPITTKYKPMLQLPLYTTQCLKLVALVRLLECYYRFLGPFSRHWLLHQR